jgi:hypothetical protein
VKREFLELLIFRKHHCNQHDILLKNLTIISHLKLHRKNLYANENYLSSDFIFYYTMIPNNQIVKLLMIDNQPEGDDFIDNPTWLEIETALHQMDGKYHTYLGLYKANEPTEGDFLMVGGGMNPQNFVCSYFTGDTEYYVINENEIDPETVVEVPIGQMNVKQKKYCNDLLYILPAVKYFYETGSMSPGVKWSAI